MGGVSLRRSADNTQAPASFVVHREAIAAVEFECDEDAAAVASEVSSVGNRESFVFIVSSAIQSDWVRTRTSKAVSMLYDTEPDR